MREQGPTKTLSSTIDPAIWEALDRRSAEGVESKRVHIERAMLSYLGPGYFESDDYYWQLAQKYGVSEIQ